MNPTYIDINPAEASCCVVWGVQRGFGKGQADASDLSPQPKQPIINAIPTMSSSRTIFLGPVAGQQVDEIKMPWIQRIIELPPYRRGFHQITAALVKALPELAAVEIGLLHVYIQHTSASLTINENADPDVPVDLESSFNSIAPEDFPYVHTIEGADDMPAHVKASLLGSSVSVPVRRGQLCSGTWQGVYLCEHRDRGGRRKLVLTLQGEARQGDKVTG